LIIRFFNAAGEVVAAEIVIVGFFVVASKDKLSAWLLANRAFGSALGFGAASGWLSSAARRRVGAKILAAPGATRRR
jgi:hypothetical protein